MQLNFSFKQKLGISSWEAFEVDSVVEEVEDDVDDDEDDEVDDDASSTFTSVASVT